MTQNQFKPILKDFMLFFFFYWMLKIFPQIEALPSTESQLCTVNLENRRFLENWKLIRTGIYLLNVSDANSRIMCEICSKLTIKTPERLRPGVLFVSRSFPLLILNKLTPAGVRVRYMCEMLLYLENFFSKIFFWSNYLS